MRQSYGGCVSEMGQPAKTIPNKPQVTIKVWYDMVNGRAFQELIASHFVSFYRRQYSPRIDLPSSEDWLNVLGSPE